MDHNSQIAALMTDRAAGRISQDAYFTSIEALHAGSAATSRSAAPPEDAARAEMAQLQQRRIDGKVGDIEYSARMSELGAALDSASPHAVLTIDSDVQREMDAMTAPAKPADYSLADPGNEPEAKTADRELRGALAELGIPALWGNAVHETMMRMVQQFSNALPETLDAHLAEFRSGLQQEWGAETRARSAAVQALLLEVASRNPMVATLLDRTPYAVADVGLSKMLWAVAERRARTKAA